MFFNFIKTLHSNVNHMLTLGCHSTANKIITLLELKMKNIITASSNRYASLFDVFHGQFAIADAETFKSNLAAAIITPDIGIDYALYQKASDNEKSAIRDKIATTLVNLINTQKNITRASLQRQRVHHRLDCEDHYLFSLPSQLTTTQGLLNVLASTFMEINNQLNATNLCTKNAPRWAVRRVD